MSDEQGLSRRQLPIYTDLGEFVLQEIPYLLKDNTDGDDNVQVVNIRFDDRLRDTITLNVKGRQVQVEGLIERLGVFKDNARRVTTATYTEPSPLEDDEIHAMIAEDRRKNEESGVKVEPTFNLVDAGTGEPVLDPIDGDPHQITKVLRIPYRWRRPDEGATLRQTYLLICYTGPSNH